MVAGLSVNAEVMSEQAAGHFTAAADLAEELTQRFGLDYRTAYRVVGRAVADTLRLGRTELAPETVRAAAEEITGTSLSLDSGWFGAVIDPETSVLARSGLGSASPRRVREHARQVHGRVTAARRWQDGRRARITEAEVNLITVAAAIAADRDPVTGGPGSPSLALL